MELAQEETTVVAVPQFNEISERLMYVRTMITKAFQARDVGLDACLIFDNCHFFNEDSSEWLSALSGLVAKEQEEFTMARLNVILAVPLARTKQQASVKVKKSDKWNAQMELSGGKDMFQSE